jgi:drug/metabolite transporter (DMT)-like permease
VQARTRALLQNVGAVLCWCLAPLAIRYLKDYFGAMAQNFFRYLASLFVLWALTVAASGPVLLRRQLRLLLSRWRHLLLLALATAAFQASFTYALYLLYPGFASLINQSTVLFSVLLAALFLPDERPTLRSGLFWLGLLLAGGGVVMTLLVGMRLSTLQVGLGVGLMLLSSASWALLGTLVRRYVPDLPTSFTLSAVFTLVTPVFLLSWLAESGGWSWPAAPGWSWGVLAVSGLIGIGLGHSLYYRAVPVLGLALSSSLSLAIPFLVGVSSFFIFGERLAGVQLLGGALLLGGCYLVIRVRFRAVR